MELTNISTDLLKMNTKGKEIFKQLLLDPNFIESICKLKNTHEIPLDGFKNEKEKEKWEKCHLFKYKDINVTKEKFDMDARDNLQLRSRTIIKDRISVYCLDLCEILKKFDLSLEWLSFIHGFVIGKDKEKLSIYSTELIRESLNGLILEEYINFRIGATKIGGKTLAETWKEDITNLQSAMQGFSEKGKRPTRAKTKLQEEIYRLTKNGKNDELIEEELYNKGKIGEGFNFWSIRKNRQRFKKKISSNG